MNKKKITGILLAFIMVLSLCVSFGITSAAPKKNPYLSDKNLTLTVGQKKTIRLVGYAYLKDKEVKKVTWTSSNKKVATVKYSGKYHQKGVITAKKTGKATIKLKYNGKSYSCKVTVKAKPKTTQTTTQAPSTTQTPNTTQPPCQHNWVYQTKKIHHEAEYETERVPVTEKHRFCNTCNVDLTALGVTETEHDKASGVYWYNAGTEENPDWYKFYNCGGSHTASVTVGYKMEKYLKSAEWDEEYFIGYKCSKCNKWRK